MKDLFSIRGHKGGHLRGFTLIELLVVIAIIGILASVVLASLNSARDKGADAAVKSNLNSVRPQMAIFYDEGNTYTDACADTNVADAMTSAMTAVAGTPTLGGQGDGECNATASEWAAWVNLKTASTSAQCVDSTGASKIITNQNSGSSALVACP